MQKEKEPYFILGVFRLVSKKQMLLDPAKTFNNTIDKKIVEYIKGTNTKITELTDKISGIVNNYKDFINKPINNGTLGQFITEFIEEFNKI
jgi:hypothetical protein